MNDKEYTYDIDKYTIGVDENGEDGIGLTIATMKDNELHILGSCYGDNARFIDLLIKENQELNQKYLNAVADYETIMFEKEQLNSLVNSCQEEIRRLKKQLTTYQILHRDCKIDNLKNISKIEEMENQQKEFINYLEDEIKRINPKELDIGELNLRLNDIKFTQYLIYKEILQKYKEIIGVSDENNMGKSK